MFDFIKRSSYFQSDEKPDPLLLVIEIKKGGKLTLNKIEIGAITDLRELSEKLKVIFDDREKSKIKDREILIEIQGKVQKEDLENLIDFLIEANASPIRLIKDE